MSDTQASEDYKAWCKGNGYGPHYAAVNSLDRLTAHIRELEQLILNAVDNPAFAGVCDEDVALEQEAMKIKARREA